LLNQSTAMKNVKNRPKTRNPPKTKKIPWLNYDFLGIFKVKKKHVILTYRTIWHKKNDSFDGRIPHQRTLSLSRNLATSSISSNNKKWKISKMKFGTKIEFCKIQGTGHPLAKKDEGLKWIFYWNFQSATYVTRFFHFSPFSFNPTISYQKTCI
jgi:hypothetical protein